MRRSSFTNFRHERKSDNFVQEFKLLLKRKDFKTDLDLIIDKWKNALPLKNSVPILLKKYNLSKNYEWAIMVYISSGKISKSDGPRYVEFNLMNNLEYAEIKVYPYTTLADVKKAYSLIIKKLKISNTKRNRRAEQFDRDMYIYELKEKGLSNKEILSAVIKQYPQKLDLGNITRSIGKIKNKLSKK